MLTNLTQESKQIYSRTERIFKSFSLSSSRWRSYSLTSIGQILLYLMSKDLVFHKDWLTCLEFETSQIRQRKQWNPVTWVVQDHSGRKNRSQDCRTTWFFLTSVQKSSVTQDLRIRSQIHLCKRTHHRKTRRKSRIQKGRTTDFLLCSSWSCVYINVHSSIWYRQIKKNPIQDEKMEKYTSQKIGLI